MVYILSGIGPTWEHLGRRIESGMGRYSVVVFKKKECSELSSNELEYAHLSIFAISEVA
jgi:hypothetical protein